MQVGTDKPRKEEVEGLSYYFYDEFTPDQDISVVDFQREGREVISLCEKEKKDLFVVGGNFLYVKALLFPYVFKKEEKVLHKSKYDAYTIEEMQSELQKRSPSTYASIDIHNPRRLIRALEQLDEGTSRKEILAQNDGKPLYPCKFYCLEIDKEEGNKKIDTRIDKMVKEGLFEEAQKLYEKYPHNSRPFSTIGYQEIFERLEKGEKPDEKTLELIKIHTHQYAKKQRTFLRHQFSSYLTYGSKEEIREAIEKDLASKK